MEEQKEERKDGSLCCSKSHSKGGMGDKVTEEKVSKKTDGIKES